MKISISVSSPTSHPPIALRPQRDRTASTRFVISSRSVLAQAVEAAVKKWAKDQTKEKMNEFIRTQAAKRGIDAPAMDYFGYLNNVFRGMGMDPAKSEESTMDTMSKMLSGEAQTPFDAYLKEGGAGSGGVPFDRFLKTLLKRRAQSKLRDLKNEKKKFPDQKSLDKEVGENGRTMGDLIPDGGTGDVDNPSYDYRELLQSLMDHVSKNDPRGDKVKLLKGLLGGSQTREIQQDLSHPSSAYREKTHDDLRADVRKYFEDRGMDDMANSIDTILKLKQKKKDKPSPSAPDEGVQVPDETSEVPDLDSSDAAPSGMPEWLKKKSPAKQEEYFKKHPDSKFAPRKSASILAIANRIAGKSSAEQLHGQQLYSLALQRSKEPTRFNEPLAVEDLIDSMAEPYTQVQNQNPNSPKLDPEMVAHHAHQIHEQAVPHA